MVYLLNENSQLSCSCLVYFFRVINFSFTYADCTQIHSKFIAPLPLEVDEFLSSLHSVFPNLLDINYLMKKHGTMRKMTNIPSAISYLNSNFFAPVDLEIPDQGQSLHLVVHKFLLSCETYNHAYYMLSYFHSFCLVYFVQKSREQGNGFILYKTECLGLFMFSFFNYKTASYQSVSCFQRLVIEVLKFFFFFVSCLNHYKQKQIESIR